MQPNGHIEPLTPEVPGVPLSTAQKSPLGCPENWTANRYILRDCYTMVWRNPADVTLRQPLLSTRLVQVLPQQLPIVFLPSALKVLRQVRWETCVVKDNSGPGTLDL